MIWLYQLEPKMEKTNAAYKSKYNLVGVPNKMKVNEGGGSILLSKGPNQPSFSLLLRVTNVNCKKPPTV